MGPRGGGGEKEKDESGKWGDILCIYTSSFSVSCLGKYLYTPAPFYRIFLPIVGFSKYFSIFGPDVMSCARPFSGISPSQDRRSPRVYVVMVVVIRELGIQSSMQKNIHMTRYIYHLSSPLGIHQ
jgi:hypothetical protein